MLNLQNMHKYERLPVPPLVDSYFSTVVLFTTANLDRTLITSSSGIEAHHTPLVAFYTSEIGVKLAH